MNKNVGKKIRVFSMLLMIVGILLSLYFGVMDHIYVNGGISTDTDGMIEGVIIIVVGVIASIILNLLVTGFGVIVEAAEETDTIKALLIEIKDKKVEINAGDNNSKKRPSILSSNFNNEVFNDRDFSGSAPGNPDYVQPLNEGKNDKHYTYEAGAASGNSRPTRPIFADSKVGIANQKVEVSENSNVVAFEEPVAPKAPAYEEPVAPKAPLYEEPIAPRMALYEEPVAPTAPTYEDSVMAKAPAYEEPVAPAFERAEIPSMPVFESPFGSPAAQESEIAPSVSYEAQTAEAPIQEEILDENSPEALARASQIQDLIYKFVARRNGKVNINDILRTVPRNIEPAEFSRAVRSLEEQGRLEKDEKGEYYAL